MQRFATSHMPTHSDRTAALYEPDRAPPLAGAEFQVGILRTIRLVARRSSERRGTEDVIRDQI